MELTRDVGGTIKGSRYYTFAGETVTVRTGTGSGNSYVLINDHHGTAHAQIKNSDNTLTRRYTDPHGNPRGTDPTWPGDHGFLDQPKDTTGLTHIGARYYDPVLGAFITTDPILDTSNPQQWAPYTYSAHNPTTHSDPTGLLHGAKISDENGGWFAPSARHTVGARSAVTAMLAATTYSSPLLKKSDPFPSPSLTSAPTRSVEQYQCLSQLPPPENTGGGLLSTIGHALLDGLGMVPVIGEAFDGINGLWYLAEGDYVAAVLSFAAMVPVAGTAATAGKWTYKGVDAAISATRTAPDLVYRGLASGDNPAVGLLARAPNATSVSPVSHVAGKIESPWISTTRSFEVATSKYGQNGVVAIDLNRVSSEVVDISGGIPNGGRMSSWAKADQEVLIRGSVPPGAIVRSWP